MCYGNPGSKKNRDYCKEKTIHLYGPKLGRPGKNYAEDIRTERREAGERNAVEGIFGNGKRKLGLSLIMAKLKETAGTMITMDVFILNMERYLRHGASFLCTFFSEGIKWIIQFSNKRFQDNYYMLEW